jgi:hypothetical protein
MFFREESNYATLAQEIDYTRKAMLICIAKKSYNKACHALIELAPKTNETH